MRSNHRLTSLSFLLFDALLFLVAGVIAAWIRFEDVFLLKELSELARHPGFILYAVVVQAGMAATFDLYRPSSWTSREHLLFRLIAMAVTLPIALALGVYLVTPWRFGRGLLALTVALALPAQGALRLLWLRAAAKPPARNAVVIGEGPIVGALIEELKRRAVAPFRIIRHLAAPDDSDATLLNPEALAEVDLVIVASLTHDPIVDRLSALNFRGITVVDSAGAYAALTGRIPVQQVDSRWFIATGDFSSLASSPFHHAQRLLDVVIATVLLIVTAPVLAIAAATVMVSSGRPILYRQVRLGRFRRQFVLLKLRTMKNGAEPNGPAFAVKNDHRLIFLGGLFRRWRVDELPQLINVLRGDMSLVGPRPERPEVAEELEKKIPFYAYRYSVRPGLTGWAQVNQPYCADTEDHIIKLEYDLYSLRRHGPTMYALVLLRTLGALVFSPGR